MYKLSRLFKAIGMILKSPALLNLIIDNDNEYKNRVLESYELKDGLPQLSIMTLWPEFNEIVYPYAFLDGGSSPLDIAVIKALAEKYAVGNVLEIGTWRGESIANLASVAKHCVTVNLPEKEVLKILPDENYLKSHTIFSRNLPNVEHISADSHAFDFRTLDKKFDMVFIDGDHHYESVKKDSITAFNNVDLDKGIIIWHDYTYSPEHIRWEVLKGILDGCPDKCRERLVHIANTNCAAYFPEDFPTQALVPYKVPNYVFEVNIKVKPFKLNI